MSFEKLDAMAVMVGEMHEAGVIGDELMTLYRDKMKAFKDAGEQYQALMAQYAGVRAGGTVDDVDRQFANEALAVVLRAQRECAIVDCAIGAVVAYRASLNKDDSPTEQPR